MKNEGARRGRVTDFSFAEELGLMADCPASIHTVEFPGISQEGY
jgi:hypothetical protein